MVHLVNNPTPLLPWEIRDNEDADDQRNHMTRFFALQEVNPIHDIKISFNDFKVQSARLPLQEQSLQATGNTGILCMASEAADFENFWGKIGYFGVFSGDFDVF